MLTTFKPLPHLFPQGIPQFAPFQVTIDNLDRAVTPHIRSMEHQRLDYRWLRTRSVSALTICHKMSDLSVPFHELENIKLIEKFSVTEGGRKIWNKKKFYIQNIVLL